MLEPDWQNSMLFGAANLALLIGSLILLRVRFVYVDDEELWTCWVKRTKPVTKKSSTVIWELQVLRPNVKLFILQIIERQDCQKCNFKEETYATDTFNSPINKLGGGLET